MCAFGVLLSSGDLTVPCKVQNLPRRGEHLAVGWPTLKRKKEWEKTRKKEVKERVFL